MSSQEIAARAIALADAEMAERDATVEWLVGTDHPERVARRLGYPRVKSLARRLERHGRHDLARAFDKGAAA